MPSRERLRTCACGVRPATDGQLVCRGCLTPLRLLAPESPDAAKPATKPAAKPAAKTAAKPAAKTGGKTAAKTAAGPARLARPAPVTVRDPVRPGLRLEFSTGAITVRAGESVTLGRAWQECPDADILASYENLSRKHATVWVDEDGNGWIRDERSKNGTFIDGRQLPRGQRVPLRPGVLLRFAADVPVTVRRSGRR